ncbi:MAG: peptidoglycan recognition family protein [Candidatus Kerfeldbacteria bacterium]
MNVGIFNINSLFNARSAVALVACAALFTVLPPPAYAASPGIAEGSIPINFSTPASDGRFSMAEASRLEVPEGEQSLTFTTGTYTPDFPFNAIGVKLTGPDIRDLMPGNEAIELAVEIRSADGTISRVLPPLGEDLKDSLPADLYITRPVMVEDPESFVLSVKLNRLPSGASPVLESAEIIYINTASPEPSVRGTAAATTADSKDGGLHIISREEWGADESYRETSTGSVKWPAEYLDPRAFIVHHTAGTDGGDDPSASVRAIYYWHAKVLGWGDIGYNYIIDPQGNIYEGRTGGDGVIGGHTFDSSNNINFNEGSVGIAIMGCFESTPGACYTTHEVTPEMEQALGQLIGAKAAAFGIQPKSYTTLQGTTTKRIVGHRDLDATYCPGSELQDDLGTIRTLSQEQYEAAITPPLEGTFIDMNVYKLGGTIKQDRLNLVAGSRYEITVRYKNTGTETWVQGETKLKIYNGSGKRPTSLRQNSWPDSLGKIAMVEETVAPGEKGSFHFVIKTPNKYKQRKLFFKVFDEGAKVKKTNATRKLRFTHVLRGELAEHTLPIVAYSGSTVTATFTFLNDGIQNWNKKTKLMVNGIAVAFLQQKVQPGEYVTIQAEIELPQLSAGVQSEVHSFLIRLKHKKKRIKGTLIEHLMRIDAE